MLCAPPFPIQTSFRRVLAGFGPLSSDSVPMCRDPWQPAPSAKHRPYLAASGTPDPVLGGLGNVFLWRHVKLNWTWPVIGRSWDTHESVSDRAKSVSQAAPLLEYERYFGRGHTFHFLCPISVRLLDTPISVRGGGISAPWDFEGYPTIFQKSDGVWFLPTWSTFLDVLKLMMGGY